MGGNASALSPPPANFPYFSLTFRKFNKIIVINCDEQTVKLIEESVKANWPKGIKSHHNANGVFEMECSGDPYSLYPCEDDLTMKKLCCELLTVLYSAGWELCLSSDLGRWVDLTTWFFQRKSELIGKQLPTDGGIVSLSVTTVGFVTLNAPVYLSDQMKECVDRLMEEQKNIDRETKGKIRGCLSTTFGLRAGTTARQGVLDIIRMFDRHKFRYYGTANHKGPGNTIFFEQDRNYTGGETRYCILSLNRRNQIRLFDCPQEVTDTVEKCIKEYWSKGMRNKRSKEPYFMIQLNGHPWLASGDEGINSRYFITHLLQSLNSIGWEIMTSLDITLKIEDKAVFVLRNCAPVEMEYFCISPSDTDLLRVINAPKDAHDAVANVIQKHWPGGIQREKSLQKAFEWKLKGYPWSRWSGRWRSEHFATPHFITILLSEIMQMGWRVVCSADISSNMTPLRGGPLIPDDAHSWFIARSGNS